MSSPMVLTIGGNDPDGCAGIAADLRTFFALGVHGCPVITAATSQNTRDYFNSFAISPQSIASQLNSVFSDLRIDAVKVGLVVGEGNVEAVAKSLRKWKAKNIVLDPVMTSQPGTKKLINKQTIRAIAKHLVPLATLSTPNLEEARALTNCKKPKQAAKKLSEMGAKNIVITGIVRGKRIYDLALINKKFTEYEKKKIKTSTHGGGCVFSSAIAANIAKRMNLRKAVENAESFISSSIANSWKPGKGKRAVEPPGSAEERRVKADLREALAFFESNPSTSALIPEVGTNIVHSLKNAKKTTDIAGVVGRVRRCGTMPCSLGLVEFGSSSHVARMLLEFSKKFRATRTAINIANTTAIRNACNHLNFKLAFADRSKEPKQIEENENQSMQWLIRNSLRGLKRAPDAVVFTGAMGKEPSLVLFGPSPRAMVEKAIKIARELE